MERMAGRPIHDGGNASGLRFIHRAEERRQGKFCIGVAMFKMGTCLAAALLISAAAAADQDGTRPDGTGAAAGALANVVQSTPAKSVRLYLAPDLNSYERAKILVAINDWNFALDGTMRFEVIDGPSADRDPLGWNVVVDRATASRASNRGYALANTMPLNGGGIVIIHAAELGSKDLSNVMRHELGHVLGLGHASAGLMSATYSSHDMKCVDHGSLQQLAIRDKLRAASLRGC
jgi:hypothetical protein